MIKQTSLLFLAIFFSFRVFGMDSDSQFTKLPLTYEWISKCLTRAAHGDPKEGSSDITSRIEYARKAIKFFYANKKIPISSRQYIVSKLSDIAGPGYDILEILFCNEAMTRAVAENKRNLESLKNLFKEALEIYPELMHVNYFRVLYSHIIEL